MCAREQHGFKKFLCKFISHMLPFLYKEVGISIHAPRVGRAPHRHLPFRAPPCFNPRAPCGARLRTTALYDASKPFQSTRPVRGATRNDEKVTRSEAVSIHAPHTGRDHGMGDFPAFWVGFQSTRPMRGATAICSRRLLCDGRFNPRAPCGARHVLRDAIVEVGKFQSTRPMRGATASLL